jgi:hypothetical protein
MKRHTIPLRRILATPIGLAKEQTENANASGKNNWFMELAL